MKGTRPAEDTHVQRDDSVLRGTKECSIRSFAFCYNNACRIHEDAKYGASYWPQEPESRGLKGTRESDEEQDRLYELDQDVTATCGQRSATMTMESEYSLINSDEDSKGTNWGYPNLDDATEAETKTATEQGSVTGIITPLDTASIASRDGRSSI